MGNFRGGNHGRNFSGFYYIKFLRGFYMDYEILKTNDGYMVLDPEGDELYDLDGNNCFNLLQDCYELIALDKAERE